ncbi:MAG: hypothetical protein LQ352_004430 [Teloschistes flavicans]|nr:MAG: hypothetical protein LQ352_004430 [Teloschistes flavicans]
MRYTFSILLTGAALLLGGQSNALGINCRGSGACDLFKSNAKFSENISNHLANTLNGLDDNTIYFPGSQLACVKGYYWFPSTQAWKNGGICAFLQNGDSSNWSISRNGWDVKYLAGQIVGHDCKTCGSVPVGWPQTNDVSQGQLTFNFVADPACDGLCA